MTSIKTVLTAVALCGLAVTAQAAPALPVGKTSISPVRAEAVRGAAPADPWEGRYTNDMAVSGSLSIGLPDMLKTDLVGARDLGNGQWLTGIEADVLWLRRKNQTRPIAYLAMNNLYNADEKGRGSVGFAIGANTGTAGEVLVKTARVILPEQAGRLEWLGKVADFVTVEYSGGYRVFGTPADLSPWVHGIGGKVRIPLGAAQK